MPKKTGTPDKIYRQYKALGEEIKKQRGFTAWTQMELSNKLGYDYPIVLKWESGEKPYPTQEELIAMANIFNIDPETFTKHIKTDANGQKEYTKKYVPEVGERIAILLEQHNMSGRQLAKDVLGQYQQHVSKYITGDSEPKLYYLIKMINHFFPTKPMEGAAYFLFGDTVPAVSYKAQVDKLRKKLDERDIEIISLKKRLTECEEKLMA